MAPNFGRFDQNVSSRSTYFQPARAGARGRSGRGRADIKISSPSRH